jgi:hypothetical protein
MSSLTNDRNDSRTQMNLLGSRSERHVYSSSPKTHLHVCGCCGHARRRDQVTSSEIGTGVFHCPNCDAEGPLNVEIRAEAFEEIDLRIA